MFGVLVDVSGSMQSAYALDRSHQADVERIHAILTTLVSIVKREIAHHKRKESIFVGAFGLENSGVGTCDLLSLLEYFKDMQTGGHEGLLELATQHKALHIAPWIQKHLTEADAHVLYCALRSDESLIHELMQLIPSQTAVAAIKTAENVR